MCGAGEYFNATVLEDNTLVTWGLGAMGEMWHVKFAKLLKRLITSRSPGNVFSPSGTVGRMVASPNVTIAYIVQTYLLHVSLEGLGVV